MRDGYANGLEEYEMRLCWSVLTKMWSGPGI